MSGRFCAPWGGGAARSLAEIEPILAAAIEGLLHVDGRGADYHPDECCCAATNRMQRDAGHIVCGYRRYLASSFDLPRTSVLFREAHATAARNLLIRGVDRRASRWLQLQLVRKAPSLGRRTYGKAIKLLSDVSDGNHALGCARLHFDLEHRRGRDVLPDLQAHAALVVAQGVEQSRLRGDREATRTGGSR